MSVVAVTACGAPTARLSGTVKVNGVPAANARIDARSEQGDRQRVATGVVLADGTYRMDYGSWPGLDPGPSRVEISYVAGATGNPLAAGEQGMVDATKATARRWHVRFERTLVNGDNKIDFELNDGVPAEDR